MVVIKKKEENIPRLFGYIPIFCCWKKALKIPPKNMKKKKPTCDISVFL